MAGVGIMLDCELSIAQRSDSPNCSVVIDDLILSGQHQERSAGDASIGGAALQIDTGIHESARHRMNCQRIVGNKLLSIEIVSEQTRVTQGIPTGLRLISKSLANMSCSF